MGAQLVDAGLVGAAAEPDPDRAAVLEHVAAVEGAGLLDARDAVAEPGERLLGARGLRLALVGAGAGDHREVAVHDRGVLDEDGVGAVVGRVHLVELPALGLERRDVAEPLPPRLLDVDRHPLEVGQQPFGETGAGPADQGTLLHLTSAPIRTQQRAPWRGPARYGRPVSDSSASASVIARSPALMPSQRSGSGSHARRAVPDPGQAGQLGVALEDQVAQRPAGQVGGGDAVADVPTRPGQPGLAVQPDRRAPVARDPERPAPGVGEPGAAQHREQVEQGGVQRREDPRVAVERGRDPRPEVVRRPAAAEDQPVVGGPLPVDDQVPVVGERLAAAPARSRPRRRRAAARSR